MTRRTFRDTLYLALACLPFAAVIAWLVWYSINL
jgi:hypothetical protein